MLLDSVSRRSNKDPRVTPHDPWRSRLGIGGVTQSAARWCGIGGVGTVARNHHKGLHGVSVLLPNQVHIVLESFSILGDGLPDNCQVMWVTTAKLFLLQIIPALI